MITNFNNLSHTSEDLFLRYVSGDISVAYVLSNITTARLNNFSTLYYSYSGTAIPNTNNPYTYIHGGTNMLTRYNTNAIYFTADTVTSASTFVFSGCTNLVYLNLPALTYIDQSFCYRCTYLEQAILPNLERLRTYAFAFCFKLESTNLDNVNLLSGSNIFYSCTNLKVLSLPKLSTISGVITGFASNCTALESVYFLNSTIITGSAYAKRYISAMFKNTPITNSTYLGYYGSIYVPSSLLTNYQTATYWSTFADRYVGV